MKLLLILALLLASCSDRATDIDNGRRVSAAAQQNEFKVIIPKDTWEQIYFEAINERANIAKLASLRAAALPQDDLETRIWIGFGVTALRGFDLKRVAGQWSGSYVQGIHPRLARSDYQKSLKPPKSGWTACWQQLLDKGVLTLPDAGSIDCNGGALDGVSYVVETNIDRTYRTYMYDNPQFASCKEAKQMIEIIDILYADFGEQLRAEQALERPRR